LPACPFLDELGCTGFVDWKLGGCAITEREKLSEYESQASGGVCFCFGWLIFVLMVKHTGQWCESSFLRCLRVRVSVARSGDFGAFWDVGKVKDERKDKVVVVIEDGAGGVNCALVMCGG